LSNSTKSVDENVSRIKNVYNFMKYILHDPKLLQKKSPFTGEI